MEFKRYTDIDAFYRDTYDVFMRHETQNLIPLGNIIIGHEGIDKTEWRDPANWLMATISDDRGILLCALMTPPHNITLYATDNEIDIEAIDCLIDHTTDDAIPGVTTESTLAICFAKRYCARKGLIYETAMNQRIYDLQAVNPAVPQHGQLRLLDNNDMFFFPYWLEAFIAAGQYGSTKMAIPQDENHYLYRLAGQKIYVLEVDGIPVSMAGFSRQMQTAVGVAFVYTPPYFRGKGHASSCVAQLSQIALDQGYSRCVLYTDLLNPTSNSIYQKIGYTPVCDSLMLRFKPADPDEIN